MDIGDLHADPPVGDTHLQGLDGIARSGEIVACGPRSDQEVSRVGRDVGELPVLAVQTIGDQDAGRRVIAKGYGDVVGLEAELEARC